MSFISQMRRNAVQLYKWLPQLYFGDGGSGGQWWTVCYEAGHTFVILENWNILDI